MLSAAGVMAVGAWLFGVEELYCLSVAALVLLAGARTWVGLRRWDLSVSRVVHPARVSAGHDARVELVVTNSRWRPSPAVQVRDPFDGGEKVARFWIGPLARGEVRRSSYRLPATHRGVHRLGPLELRITDAFGLAVATRRTTLESTLTVHPAYELVPVVGLSSHRDDDRRRHRPMLGSGGTEFFTLREYVPGDDLRHVHWRSTARLGELVIRQPESQRRGRITVAVDLRAEVVDEPTAERIVSAAASLAISALRSGTQVRVVTTDGWDSGHGSGRGHDAFVLDGLAAAKRHRGRPGTRPFRLAGGMEPVIVLTTDAAAEADLLAAFGMNGPRGTTLVIFAGGAGGGGAGGAVGAGGAGGGRVGAGGGSRFASSARGQVVRVGPADSFAAVWALHAAVEVN